MRRVTPEAAALKMLEALEFTSEQEFSERKDSEIIFKLEDWRIGREYKTLPPPELLDSIAISKLSSDRRRLQFMVQLSKSVLASASELLDLYTHKLEPVALNLSKGLSSLPDELLGSIFQLATSHKIEGTRHAVWLSHVSRRFRRICVDDHSLWSVLSLREDTTKEIIESCISRSGNDTDLHIVINYNCFINSSALHDFMATCLPSASRWRSLTVAGDWFEKDGGVTIGRKMDELMGQHPLVLPRLDELSVVERRHDEIEGDPIWNFYGNEFSGVPWVAPNLRFVQCTQYIPPPSFPFFSLTSFSLFLTLLPGAIPDQIRGLVSFLSSKHCISVVVLELDNFDGADCKMTNELRIAAVVCPSITTFQLNFSNFALEEGAENVIGPALQALKMPRLEHFSLSIALRDRDHDRLYFDGISLRITGVLLPDIEIHPRLKTFTVNMRFVTGLHTKRMLWNRKIKMTIPLHRIPYVSSLFVTTIGDLSFTRRTDFGHGAAEPSSLRELQLRSCRNMNLNDLEKAIQSLKDVDAWDMLNHIVIDGCDLLNYEAVAKATGKEKLRFAK